MADRERYRDLERGEHGYKIFSEAVDKACDYELENIPEDCAETIYSFIKYVTI